MRCRGGFLWIGFNVWVANGKHIKIMNYFFGLCVFLLNILKTTFSCARKHLVLLLLSDDWAASSRFPMKPPPHFCQSKGVTTVACLHWCKWCFLSRTGGFERTNWGSVYFTQKKIIPGYLYGLKAPVMIKKLQARTIWISASDVFNYKQFVWLQILW